MITVEQLVDILNNKEATIDDKFQVINYFCNNTIKIDHFTAITSNLQLGKINRSNDDDSKIDIVYDKLLAIDNLLKYNNILKETKDGETKFRIML
jgi:hypothetical protein